MGNQSQNQSRDLAPVVDDEYLNKIYEKNEFSGFDRQDSVKIIRDLIKEIRLLKIIAKTSVEALHNSDKERAKFEEECG